MRVKKERKKRELPRFIAGLFRRKQAQQQRPWSSELHQHPYGYPETPQPRRKIFDFLRWKRGAQQKKAFPQESYHTRKTVRRRWPRWWWPAAAVLLLVLVGYYAQKMSLAKELLGQISFFQVHSLRFTGVQFANRQQLQELSGVVENRSSLLALDAEAISKKLLTDAWVSQVEVRKKWPSTLEIAIVEHKPVALVNTLGDGKSPQLSYVDARGVSFLPLQSGQDTDYPVVSGLDRLTGEQEKAAAFADIMMLLKKAGRNNPNLPAQAISEILVDKNSRLVLFLVDHPFPIFFGKGAVDLQFGRLVKVLEALYSKNGGVDISDVEYIQMDYQHDQVRVQKKSG